MKKVYPASGLYGHPKEDFIMTIKLPDWIKKAKKNRMARVRYYAKKYGVSIKEAEQIVNEKDEEAMME